jgi:acyl carrier protein
VTKEEIKRHFCAVLSEVQTDSGKDAPSLNDDTVPLTDLPDLDSLSRVDATVRLSERIGIEIKEIPFEDPKTGKEYSIQEIVALLEKAYGKNATGESDASMGGGGTP